MADLFTEYPKITNDIFAEYPEQEFKMSDVDYDITGELKIRKILENHTDYRFEFIKNNDIYDNDIKIFEYLVNGNEWDKRFLGFVEVEKAIKWTSMEIPSYWYCVSFLGRKLFKFSENGYNINNPVDNANLTIYLKFNYSYTNCFCQTKDFIIKNGKESHRNGINKNLSRRKDFYWELEVGDVVWGIDDCCEFIKEKFKIK